MSGTPGRGVARLTQFLRGRAVDAGTADVLRARLEQTRAAAVAWKKKARDTAAHARVMRERLTRIAAALRQTRARLIVAQRDRPSIGLADVVFSHRLTTLGARVAARSVTDREDRLVKASPAYRAAVDGTAEVPGSIRRPDVPGMTWWIPAGGTDARRGAERFRLPFRGMVQTRDLTRGGIMLDIGANVGRMAIPRVVMGDVLVAYCAEPDPTTFACLVRNVVDNGLRGLVLPDQTAIGDRNGTVPLLRSGSSENFRVVPAGGAGAGATVTVPSCTLDTWVERLGIDLDAVTYIKVDVEGYERRLIAGAGRVLELRHIAWQMEIKPAGLMAAGDDPEDLYAELGRRFTHFMDLNRRAVGPPVRPAAELPTALRYLMPTGKTDVLLFSSSRVSS